MGLNQSTNPSADFVLELMKNMDRDGMEQIARYVVKRLDDKPVIDIPSTETNTREVRNSFEPNQLFQMLLGNQGLSGKSLGPLFDLLKNRLNTTPAANSEIDYDDDDDDEDDENRKLVERTEPASTSPFSKLFYSFLPEILDIGNEIINPKSHTREEVLLDAILPYLPQTRQSSLRSLQPAIRLFGVLQSRGILSMDIFQKGLGGLFPAGLFTRGPFAKSSSKESDSKKHSIPKISRKAIKEKIRKKFKFKSSKKD